MTPLAEAMRPHVEALYKAGIKTGGEYEQLAAEIIDGIYAVPDEWLDTP